MSRVSAPKRPYFGSRGRAARCTEGLSDASAATHGFADCARIDRMGAQAAAVTASEMMAMLAPSHGRSPSYRQLTPFDSRTRS